MYLGGNFGISIHYSPYVSTMNKSPFLAFHNDLYLKLHIEHGNPTLSCSQCQGPTLDQSSSSNTTDNSSLGDTSKATCSKLCIPENLIECNRGINTFNVQMSRQKLASLHRRVRCKPLCFNLASTFEVKLNSLVQEVYESIALTQIEILDLLQIQEV